MIVVTEASNHYHCYHCHWFAVQSVREIVENNGSIAVLLATEGASVTAVGSVTGLAVVWEVTVETAVTVVDAVKAETIVMLFI